MKDFDRWFADQGTKQDAITDQSDDDVILVKCCGCGREALHSEQLLINGDEWAFYYGDGYGLCGDSNRCVP